MYSGVALATAALLFWWPASGLGLALPLAGVAIGLTLPTYAQPFVQKRWFKIPSRFLLGVGFALMGGALLFAGGSLVAWVARLGMLGVTLALARLAVRLRDLRLDDPCHGCGWGSFPLCAHNLDALILARSRADPATAAFLDAVIADLEPLRAFPPRWGAAPPRSGPVRVGFVSPER
jgi:hypothetical protein